MVSPDLDEVADRTTVFVPKVAGQPYRWKVTGIDYAGRQVAMVTPLLAVPSSGSAKAREEWNKIASAIDVGGAEVAFGPPDKPGDTTARVQYIDFTGEAEQFTGTPWMVRAHITIPALSAINRGGGPVAVRYPPAYVKDGFQLADPAKLFSPSTARTPSTSRATATVAAGSSSPVSR
ncbi:hypothetical protein ACLMAJ_29260 [Nocardia sp. KC 131]|uniref:hypothetical protein n=1 Tax=Nocardia arseniciresistens TaxID=3392119 RepID=UPI00398E68EF